jgi:hypothetical protein
VVLPCCRGWKVRWWCYLSGHLLGLLLQLLDDLIAGAAVVAPRRRAVLLPLLQTDPAEVILALQRERERKIEKEGVEEMKRE